MPPILIETFLQEVDGLRPDQLFTIRLGLKISPARRAELLDRVGALFNEYAQEPTDDDGETISLLFVEHPDLPRDQRPGASGG